MIRHMRLSGRQIEKLQRALIDAFPNKSSLQQMLLFKLDKNIHEFAGGNNLETVVFELITAANSQGWIEHLISSACEDNPGNLLLKNVCQELLANPSVPQNLYTAQSYNKVDLNSKSINPLKTVFSKRLAVIVGVIATGTMFSTVLFSNQLPQLAENPDTNRNPIPTKVTPTPEPNSALSLTYEDYYRLGQDKSSKKEYEEAIRYFNEAIQLNPNNPYYYSSRGFARSSSKDYNGAIEDYTKAIKFGECGCFFENRADIYSLLGNKDKATGDYQDAVHLYNKNKEEKESENSQQKLDQLCKSSQERLRGCNKN